MILIYSKIPKETIRKDAKKLLQDIETFFVNNPKRRVCRVEVWYGKVISFKKNNIKQTVDDAVKAALSN